jgi:hypothetical protein
MRIGSIKMFRDITTVFALVACASLPGPRYEIYALTPPAFPAQSQAHRLQRHELEGSEIIRAKAADKDKQQELVCAFYGKSADRMYIVASAELPAIGGWFAIRTYSLVLQPDTQKRWGRGHSDANDVFRPSPTDIVFQKLPGLVPDLPKADPSNPNETAAVWMRYLDDHKTELSKLQPTGEGVDFSGESCKSKHHQK